MPKKWNVKLDRQRIKQMLAQGCSYYEIAKELNSTPNSIRTITSLHQLPTKKDYKIALTKECARVLSDEALARDMLPNELMSALLSTVVKDDLFDAILGTHVQYPSKRT